MTQLLLPFCDWQHPWWVLTAFEIANASDAYWKHRWFYQFKDQFLRAYAVPDGWDLQDLTLKCWTCGGSGIYVGYTYSGFQYDDICRRCLGTGIYLRREICLRRFLLGNSIYHIPGSAERCDEVEYSSPPRNRLDSRIRHSPRGFWVSTFCAWALFLVFDLPRGKKFFAQVIRRSWREAPGVRWVFWQARRSKRGLEAVGQWLFRRTQFRAEEDDIPF